MGKSQAALSQSRRLMATTENRPKCLLYYFCAGAPSRRMRIFERASALGVIGWLAQYVRRTEYGGEIRD